MAKNRFPVKYIENNLVLNQKGEWYAYYELIPYNYSFLSVEQKFQLHEALRRLVAQSREGKMHFLEIATEESIRRAQELSKKEVRGTQEQRELTYDFIDQETENIISSINPSEEDFVSDEAEEKNKENMVDYRFFLGMKLLEADTELTLEGMKEQLLDWLINFIMDVNHELMGDFVSVRNKEVERYQRLERLLEKRLSGNFKVRRAEQKDFGYIMEHIYGKTGVAYDDYNYYLPHMKVKKETLVKYHDIIKVANTHIKEFSRYLHMTSEKEDMYVAYFTINEITGDLEFPSSEILYEQQELFDFPVDVSINVEIVSNRKALTTVRNKKKELKDLDNHAYSTGNEESDSVSEALDDVTELETELSKSKESMYKLSYVVRVTAKSEEELKMRCASVRDAYDNYNVKLVRPFGNMLRLQNEFLPASNRAMNDYVQYVTSDFLAGLGFGAAQMIGERFGLYVGYCKATGRNVYIRPWLAAQGILGTVTNSLSAAFLGTLGGGKSMADKLLQYGIVLFGGKILSIDPKGEYTNFKHNLPEIADRISIVNLTSEEKNKGMLDPYVIMENVRDAEGLAKDILTYLLGINSRDGQRYPVLCKALRAVSKSEKKGLFKVVEELRKMENDVAESVALHIESFAEDGFAQLLFSDGTVKKTISLCSQWNVIQVQDLLLPEQEKAPEEYSQKEQLSVALMIAISTFALDFIRSDNTFKVVNIDEAWSILNVAQGKALSNKLVRAGRSMNAAIYFITQNADDLQDEKIKNNIGMKFAFRSRDINEIRKTLTFFGLDADDEGNQSILRNLNNGECLFQDIYGRTAVIYWDWIFPHLFKAFDTRPPEQAVE